MIRNFEILNRAWRYRTATRFDASRAIKQQHAAAFAGEIIGSRRTCRTATVRSETPES